MRFFQPVAQQSPRTEDLNNLNPGNFLASLGRGLFGGMLDQLGSGSGSSVQNRNTISRGPDTSGNSFLAQILPNAKLSPSQPNLEAKNEAARKQLEQSLIASLLQSAFTK